MSTNYTRWRIHELLARAHIQPRTFSEAEERADIWLAVRRLGEIYTTIYELSYVRGCTLQEIQNITGWRKYIIKQLINDLPERIYKTIGMGVILSPPSPLGRGPIPSSYAYTTEGHWPTPATL